MKRILILIILVLIFCGYSNKAQENNDVVTIGYQEDKYIKKEQRMQFFKGIDLTNVYNVMIVAHPDDEIIFGGSELIKERYFVVCVTCGGDTIVDTNIRIDEFDNVMKKTNDSYSMLYIVDWDKKNNGRAKWDKEYEIVSDYIKDLLSFKRWNKIVTHNPEGEYGHIHHILTSEITTNVYNSMYPNGGSLYYFDYRTPNLLKENISEYNKIDESIVNKKMDLMKMYKSQDGIIEWFNHWHSYQRIINANDWNR